MGHAPHHGRAYLPELRDHDERDVVVDEVVLRDRRGLDARVYRAASGGSRCVRTRKKSETLPWMWADEAAVQCKPRGAARASDGGFASRRVSASHLEPSARSVGGSPARDTCAIAPAMFFTRELPPIFRMRFPGGALATSCAMSAGVAGCGRDRKRPGGASGRGAFRLWSTVVVVVRV